MAVYFAAIPRTRINDVADIADYFDFEGPMLDEAPEEYRRVYCLMASNIDAAKAEVLAAWRGGADFALEDINGYVREDVSCRVEIWEMTDIRYAHSHVASIKCITDEPTADDDRIVERVPPNDWNGEGAGWKVIIRDKQ